MELKNEFRLKTYEKLCVSLEKIKLLMYYMESKFVLRGGKVMQGVFLRQFLMISDWKTIVFILVFIILVIGILKIPKKKFSFSTRVLISTIVGLLLGLVIQVVSGFSSDPMSITFVKETTMWYSLIGNGFIDFIRMLVIPLVMISIVHVIIHMDKQGNVRALVQRSIMTTMVMVAISAMVGIIFGILFQVGGDSTELAQSENKIKEVVSVVKTLRNLIPSNPVVAMVNSNVVGLVIFSAFFGFAAKRLQKKYADMMRVFYDLTDALHKIIVSIAMTIIKGMPYAVLALLANTIAQRGLNSILEVGKFIILIYAACIVMFVIQLFSISLFKINPITYIKKSYSLMLLAFTSRSSLGVLPATIDTLTEKLGVSQGTASFVGSFGTTAGMQGCAGVFPALLIVYVTNMTGGEINLSLIIMSILVITIGSVGIAGIPGTSTMAASVGLSGVGLGSSFSLITPILAVDPVVDMCRTWLNVTGTMTNAMMVDRQMNLMDMNKFHDMSLVDLETESELK